jgi:diadenosine tetraphosphatase ApaH/serine/threonine PP2A family protein phosphatase
MQAVYLDYNLVHASPGHPEQWNYILNRDQAAEEFDNFDESVCFLGHSHLPIIFMRDAEGAITQSNRQKLQLTDNNRYIINVGSVGQPRDNDPRSCYVLVDHENRVIEYRRVEYDIAKVQEKMRKAMLPDFLIERIAVGR